MLSSRNVRLSDHFGKLSDPRRRKVVYPLVNIVTIAICAVICGADDFVAIAAFGRKKKAWLSRFLDLSAGIPSHDRFNAIFGALQPAEFAAPSDQLDRRFAGSVPGAGRSDRRQDAAAEF